MQLIVSASVSSLVICLILATGLAIVLLYPVLKLKQGSFSLRGTCMHDDAKDGAPIDQTERRHFFTVDVTSGENSNRVLAKEYFG
jgi:hypothetical protein